MEVNTDVEVVVEAVFANSAEVVVFLIEIEDVVISIIDASVVKGISD